MMTFSSPRLRAGMLSACLVVSTLGSAEAAPVLLGRTSDSQKITVALVLPSRDPRGAASFVAHVSRPGDALFHHYLTPAEYAQRFGAAPADYAAVLAWAAARGLAVGEPSQSRHLVLLSAPAARLAAALGVHFNDYRDSSGARYFAADGKPALPAAWAARVGPVLGLSSAVEAGRRAQADARKAADHGASASPGRGYSAADLRKIYYIPTPSYPGIRETVGVFAQSGFEQSDIAAYLKANHLPAVPVSVRPVDGYGGGVNYPPYELTAETGIEMAIAINPALAKVIVYETDDDYPVAILATLAAMARDHTARAITLGVGAAEGSLSFDQINAENTLFTQLAAQGQTVLAGAGDNGAYDIDFKGVYDPAAQPLVTGVGGTTLFTRPGPTYYVEETWNGLATFNGGGGGGVSTQWPLPDWQSDQYGAPYAVANGGSSTFRNVPDVAAVGDGRTGVAVYSALSGGWGVVGGTTVSSGIWAGYISIANADSEALAFGPLGFVNPGIYAINGRGNRHFDVDTFDVVDGNNGDPADYFGVPGFGAGPGYDNTSGWGSPIGRLLGVDLALLGSNSYSNPPPAPTGLSATVTANSAHVKWTYDIGNNGYVVLVYSGSGDLATYRIVRGSSCTIDGLKSRTIYQVIVAAVTAGGNTGSDRVIITTASGK